MDESKIKQLPIPELNKLCRQHKVDLELPLKDKRAALLKALSKPAKADKDAKTVPPKKGAEKPAPAAKPKAAKAPEPEEDDEDDEEETPKKSAKPAKESKPEKAAPKKDETPVGKKDQKFAKDKPSLEDRVAALEATVSKLADASLAKPAKAKTKPAKEDDDIEDDEEETDEDSAVAVPEALLPFIKEHDGGFQLDFELEQIEEMSEEVVRGCLDVLGVEHDDIGEGKVRKLQARLREHALKQQKEDEDLIEEIEEAKANTIPTRPATKDDVVYGKNCAYLTEDDDGEEQSYAAVFVDPEKKKYKGEGPVPKKHVRIAFVDDMNSFMDVPLASVIVAAEDEESEEEEDEDDD